MEEDVSLLPVLNTLWVEGPLSYVEQVCLTSALTCGHKVVLYTYFDVTGVPEGVEVRDGREIMSQDKLVKYEKRDSWALSADIFRYEMIKKNVSIWIDTDVYIIKPIQNKSSEYMFAWQDKNFINNAVLFLSKDGQLLDQLLKFTKQPTIIPPWLSWRKKLRQRLRPLVGLYPLKLYEQRWGTTGPKALTHFAQQLDLTHHAAPTDVFYPLPPRQANLLFDPEADVESFITERTVAIHLWNERIKDYKRQPPPDGSFMARICAEHDVPTHGDAVHGQAT